MKYELVKDFPNPIIFEEQEPCISLYQTTYRHSPESQQNMIMFKNLLQKVEDELGQKYRKAEILAMMEALYELKSDKGFWENALDSVAVLANPNKCIVYKLVIPVQNLAVVADSFHIKPLIRAFQTADQYHVLSLSGSVFSLFEGNQYGLKEIKLPEEISTNIKDILGREHTGGFLNHSPYKGEGGNPMYHGQGGKKDEVDLDMEKYFRYVDKTITKNYSLHSKLPVVLVALSEHQGLFRKISDNPYLLKEGIKAYSDSLAADQLREETWKLIQPIFEQNTNKMIESYEKAKLDSQASDNITKIAVAAAEKKIKTLIVEADKIIPGKFYEESGRLEFGDFDAPEYGDMLDNLIKFVIKNKGEVIVLPKEDMPTDTGIAAVFRF